MRQMSENSHFSKNLNRLRNARGWSQQQLADFAGVSLQTIFRAESKGITPRGGNISKIAKALKVSDFDLFRDPSETPRSLKTIANMTQDELTQTIVAAQKRSDPLSNLDPQIKNLIIRIQSRLTTLNEHQLGTILGLIDEYDALSVKTRTLRTSKKPRRFK